MPVLFSFLLKLSVSLSVVFLFYHFVLRRLTFYNWNRFYLLAYTLLAFFIPFINISPVLEKNEWNEHTIITWIPQIGTANPETHDLTTWDAALLIFAAGAFVFFIRLIIQFISYSLMKRKAIPVKIEGLNIYQVDEKIIPFSFGNSIFINRHQHNETELQEIIRHEFIHVKQKHSFDIIWAELFCMLNWYNPFAWLLKKAIRQNLEFIADNKVIENGIDKKQYQYLLLKVIGNSQFSIANQFNFSSLKKRIAMMNKTKSAKRQLLRMLFLLPATAVLLLAFRNSMHVSVNEKKDGKSFEKIKNQQLIQSPSQNRETILRDTVPEVKEPNNKGYIINIKDKAGECEIVIKDKSGKEVKRLLLTEWDKNAEANEKQYGKIPPPPPAPISKPGKPDAPANFDAKENKVTVTQKNGATAVYDLADPVQKTEFQTLYGKPAIATVDAKSSVDVAVVGIPIATTKKTDAVVVEEKALTTKTINGAKIAETLPAKSLNSEKVTIAEKPLNVSGEFKEIKVEGKPLPAKVKSSKPGLEEEKAVVDEVVVVGKPKLSKTKTMTANVNLAFEERPEKESGIVNIGGLSMKDEQQYILVDGKHYNPKPGDKLQGKFRITFLDKDEAVKKYGQVAKNGAIIAETIK
jgi:beta-lactamase regulating signal transducer with metallopeptidase domain